MGQPENDVKPSSRLVTYCYDVEGLLYEIQEFGISRAATDEERNRGKNPTCTGLTARLMTPEESQKYFGPIDNPES